jgi:uncharacterized protein (DUF362 family)
MTQDVQTILETLAAQAHPEGGWGYAPGQPAQPEPTCLALVALSRERERYAAVIDVGYAALQKAQAADGTYRLIRGREEAVWPTALVLFAQTVLGRPDEEVRRTAAGLLALRGEGIDDTEACAMHDIDVRLIGWSWAEGTFSWVEPTAWACLALNRAGYGDHPRVEEGIKLILDRAFDEGGINYGNRKVFGRMTEAIPIPTALMLLALQGRGDHPRLSAALGYLRDWVTRCDDVEDLCWTKLAFDVYRDRPGVAAAADALDDRIARARKEREATSWLRAAPVRDALCALALGTDQGNPFRLGEAADGGPITAAERPARKPPLGDRIRSVFRGLAVDAVGKLRQPPPLSAVHIAPVTDYNADLPDLLRRQYEAFRQQVPLAGKRVVLKPNLVEYQRNKVINTHPNVVAAVIELCKREGAAEIIVAEGPGHWRNVEWIVKASGLGDVLRHYQVPFVDLNHDEPVKTPNLGRLTRLEYLYLCRTVVAADVLISIPKLKTHHWAGATLALKNLFGTMPGTCYGWPKNELHWRGIDNSIVDIALTRPPDLAIVDAIVGMEGDGPLNGTAKPLGAIIMGCDSLAVDATCCRLMKLNPERVGYLMLGQMRKLGVLREAQIPLIGEKVEPLAQPFETVPQFQQLYVGRSA